MCQANSPGKVQCQCTKHTHALVIRGHLGIVGTTLLCCHPQSALYTWQITAAILMVTAAGRFADKRIMHRACEVHMLNTYTDQVEHFAYESQGRLCLEQQSQQNAYRVGPGASAELDDGP